MPTAVQTEQRIGPCSRWPTFESVEENLRHVRDTATTVRHAAEGFADDATQTIRRHPLRFVGGAVIAGAVAGSLLGFGAAWYGWTRRR